MKKRILAMLLSVSLLLSLPGIALAEDIQNTSSSGDLSAYEDVTPDEEKDKNNGKNNENENMTGENGGAVPPDDNAAQPGENGSSTGGQNGENTGSAPAEGGENGDSAGNENNGSATDGAEKPDDGSTDTKPVDPPASAPAAKPGEENGETPDSGEVVTPENPETPETPLENPETPVTPVTPAEPQPGAPAACEECGALDGHEETCSQYVAPVTACPDCGLTDGHAEDCPNYTAPVAEIYDTLLAAESVEELYDLLFADLNGEGESLALTAEQKAAVAAHAAALNEAEASEVYEDLCEILELMGAEIVHPLELLEVGDTIWIKSGSKTYKRADDSSDSRDVLFNYKTQVKDIVQNGNTIWYEFEPTGLLNLFKEYKFVKAVDTSVTEPVDDVQGVTYVTYEDGPTDSGVSASISAPEGVFPEGTTVTVTDDDTVTLDDVLSALDGIAEEDIEGIVAVDITFSGSAQPGGNVVVTLNVPANEEFDGANMVYIIHMGASGPELVTRQYLNTANEDYSLTFGASSFSSYAAVFVDGKYSSKKLSSFLASDSQYEIKPFNVDLFDYDPVEMNKALNVAAGGDDTTDANAFMFRGFYGLTNAKGTTGINDSDQMAKQGIVQNSLTNGLPVFNFIGDDTDTNKSRGTATGKVLFDTGTTVEGKTTYKDTKFEFIYDKTTGYYTYQSDLNHAQYNKDNNTIELYADTLSTQNQYLATLDLSAYYGSDRTLDGTTLSASYAGWGDGSIKVEGGVWKGTSVANGDRFDSYITFRVPAQSTTTAGQPADKIEKIYIKAKIPASVGWNNCQVFFTTDDSEATCAKGDIGSKICEEKSFIQSYTANGDYIEIVIDTSSNENWKGNITNLRIDLFDGNKGNGLTDLNKTYNVEIAQISLISDYNGWYTFGGFYPFSKIESSYPGNNNSFDLSSWKTALNSRNYIDSTNLTQASRSMFNPTPSGSQEGFDSSASSEALTSNLFFGTVMEFDFYIPVSGKVNGEDLTYTFSGDDDLWVFVDDQLVLDIGGGHGAITGTIDFTNGESTVNKAVTVTGYNTSVGKDNAAGTDETAEELTVKLADVLCSPGKHTMKIFYMERCGTVSNCFMKFNLPQTPEGSVVVSKKATIVDDGVTTACNNEFTFQITATNKDTNGTSVETLEYTLTGSSVFDKKSVKNGETFKLTDGQSATFTIPENYEVTVKEITDSIDKAGYSRVTTLNGDEKESGTDTTAEGKTITFEFVNTYTALYGNLKITKKGIKDIDNDADEAQNTIFHVTGRSDSGKEVDLKVTILGNDSVTIKHLPVGTYQVKELTDWGWRYTLESVTVGNVTVSPIPSDGKYNVLVKAEETPEIVFTNTRTEDKWLSGDCYCENWWDKEKGIIVPNKKPGEADGNPEVIPPKSDTSAPAPSEAPATET